MPSCDGYYPEKKTNCNCNCNCSEPTVIIKEVERQPPVRHEVVHERVVYKDRDVKAYETAIQQSHDYIEFLLKQLEQANDKITKYKEFCIKEIGRDPFGKD